MTARRIVDVDALRTAADVAAFRWDLAFQHSRAVRRAGGTVGRFSAELARLRRAAHRARARLLAATGGAS